MLVLSRKVGECIRIEGGITLRVLESQGHRVRLGIDAPRNLSIWRGELDRAGQTHAEVELECVTCAADEAH